MSEEFPSNSHKKKENDEVPKEKIIEKVTVNEVVEIKPGIGRSFKHIFSRDHVSGIGEFVLESVIIPALKGMFYDSTTKGLERALWGEDRHVSRPGPGPVNYSSISSPRTTTYTSPSRRETSPDTDLRFETRVEGEMVLENLSALIEQYGSASVSDYYEMVGRTAVPYTDNKWGWTSLRGARVVPLRGSGFMIELPPAKPL